MEKIKNLLSPGRTQDDETLYGQGESPETNTRHTSGLAGEGSHFGNTRDVAGGGQQSSGLPGSFPSDTADNTSTPHSGLDSSTTTGPHDSNLANRADPTVDSDRSRGTTGTGIGNTERTGLGSGATSTAGPHSSNLANRADPTVDSDLSRSRDTTGAGIGNNQFTGPASGNTQTTGTSSGTTDPAFDDVPRGPGGGILNSHTSGNNTGTHNSSLLNRADPRTDPDVSRTAGNLGSSNTDPTNTGSEHHPGRDVAALGTAGAVGEGTHHHRDNQRDNLGSSTTGSTGLGNTSSNTNSGYGNTASTNPSSGHHLGRDAAALGTAGAVGEGIHHHRENQRDNLGSSTTGSTGLDDKSYPNSSSDRHLGRDAAALGTGSAVGEGIHHHRDHQRDNLGSSTTGSTGLGNTSTNPSSGHHLGRDAAALGTAGAVGEGIHHHHNERDNLGSNTYGTSDDPSGFSSSRTGPSGNSGLHNTYTANLLDPRVNTGGPTEFEDAHHHSKKHGGGAEEADHHHHLGRDAAVGVGGVGLAEHEHSKHQQRDTTGSGRSSGLNDPSTGYAANPARHDSQRSDDHLGRDAAVAGGVGATGYEAEKHRHNKRLPTTGNTSSGLGNEANTSFDNDHSQGHHHGRDAALAGGAGAAGYETGTDYNKTSSGTDSGVAPLGSSTTSGQQSNIPDRSREGEGDRSKDHHYGRDAALAGGAGAAGYETGGHYNKISSGTDSGVAPLGSNTTSGQQSNLSDRSLEGDRSKDHHYGRDAAVAGGVGGAAYEADKHHTHNKDLKAAEKEQNREHKHEEKKEHKGLLSFLHRDKDKHGTHDSQGLDNNETDRHAHEGRYAAGAGVGAGAYEAEKHHGQHSRTHDGEINKPLPTAPGNHGIGTGAGTQNALAEDNTYSGQHLGRDATAIGGAGALGEHERHEHAAGALPLEEKPRGTDIGDKLHGSDRNRGVTGATGFPDQEGFGSGPSHGVGAQSSGVSGQQHHLGRDAAFGAGGAGLAEHEHQKHEGLAGNQYNNSRLTGSDNQYDNTSSGLTGSHQARSTGHDASGLGAAEQAGERKYDAMTGQQGGFATDNQSSSFGNQGTSGLAGSNIESQGRNRLHKDPPPNHPAAQ